MVLILQATSEGSGEPVHPHSSQEPSLIAHMKYGNGHRARLKIGHLAPLDGCSCAFEERVCEDRKYHNLMTWLISDTFAFGT